MSGSVVPGAELEAARLLLARMGISPSDLLEAPTRTAVPTFSEYVPVVAGTVTAGTRQAYGSYWDRVVQVWGDRRLDEPAPSEIQRLAEQIKARVVARRNARGGRSAAEHLISALRCLYRRAVADGLLTEDQNPARKVAKPRRLPSTRRAVPEAGLVEINHVAAATGNDPELDTLLLRLHTETACRRGGAFSDPGPGSRPRPVSDSSPGESGFGALATRLTHSDDLPTTPRREPEVPTLQ